MGDRDTTLPASQLRFQPRTEAARERDVFRHLHPWASEYGQNALHRQAFPADDDQPMSAALPCPDTTLVALAQLVALRLHARRCLITLTSSSAEYTLAESTKSISLQYDTSEDPNDKAWLGTCSYLRDEGLNSAVIEEWRRARQPRDVPGTAGYFYTQGSSPHWHIISDVRGHEAFAQRSFVRRSFDLRFYASIPLRGATGSVLGSLTVLDDTPRYGVSAAEMAFLEDVADTVTQHLDATIIRSQRQRSERMVQSLGLFNNGKSSLRHWWLKQEDARVSNTGRHRNQKMTKRERTKAADAEFGLKLGSSSDKETSSATESRSDEPEPAPLDVMSASSTDLQNAQAGAARKHAHVSGRDFGKGDPSPRATSKAPRMQHNDDDNPDDDDDNGLTSPPPTSSKPPVRRLVMRRGNTFPGLAPDGHFDLSTASRNTYARASNLMREALNATGVVFVSASMPSSKVTSRSESSSASNRFARPVNSDEDRSDSKGPRDELCTIHAFSSMEKSSVRGSTDLAQHFDLPKELLSLLIRRYPNGHIFNFSSDGAYCSSSGDDSLSSASGSASDGIKKRRAPRDGRRLGEIMKGARTIAFYPTWDEIEDRVSSCAFVWSTSPLRYFDPVEDITYLASWGHSILSELGRLQTIAADKAKGTFISSVSHELRSPLHGVLAGVDFLLESDLTSFQQEMAHTISIAGRTLLDTVNHILEYAKMSNFTRAERRQRADVASPLLPGDTSNRDSQTEIGLTPNVELARLTEEVIETVVSAHRFQNSRKSGDVDLSVAVNIPWRKSWLVDIQPGGWTRIVQNLVGNALKYTVKGIVSIRMEVDESKDDTADDQKHCSVRLTVQDSGIGISKQFLSDNLYTPFKQENSHSTGTGLGLSIVKQICKDMGATLDITSELGEGTKATVDLPVSFISDSAGKQSDSGASASDSVERKRDLNVSLYHWIVPEANDQAAKALVGINALETAKSWLACETSQSAGLRAGTGPQLYAIMDKDLSDWVSEGSNVIHESMEELAAKCTHVLVLSSSLQSVSSVVPPERLPFIPIFVHQPIGPQKLLRAIVSDQNSTQLASLSSGIDGRRLDLLPVTPPCGAVMASPSTGYFTWGSSGTSHKGHDMVSKATSPSVPSTQPSSIGGTKGRELLSRSTRAGASYSSSAKNSIVTSSQMMDSGEDDENDDEVDDEEQPQQNTVLLVEDNEVNMKLLTTLMRKQGIRYVCATNGQEAIDAYQASPSSFYLTLMDMSMPIMDGFTATAGIREIERKKRLQRSLIVALTGVTSDESKERAFASGVDEFFSKPVHIRELRALVTRAKRREAHS